jgi:CheY-like chemotaxis protein
MTKWPASPRVLVVDDSVVVRRVLSMTLRQIAEFVFAEIDEAPSGEHALIKLREGRYDLVLSDVRMPGMDGLTLVRRIREELNDRTTPVIMISTLGTDEDIQRGLECGATAYITKPIAPHNIITSLQDILKLRRRR